jgi:antitoxin VapB
MGMQLNIKNEDAYRLASRLSELTGDSLTTVVTRALRAELAREENMRDRDALKARLRAIAQEIRAGLPADITSNHDFLYDDATGLPK